MFIGIDVKKISRFSFYDADVLLDPCTPLCFILRTGVYPVWSGLVWSVPGMTVPGINRAGPDSNAMLH
eukprot:scaffold925_cov129-Cylindrotheca_fusiformis.AAC.10